MDTCYIVLEVMNMQQYENIVEMAKNYVNENIDKAISVEDIANQVNYSRKQLNRIFIMMTGITPSEYVRWTRLTKAVFEIKYSDIPIIEIILKYGYESQEGFTRTFKETFGVTPGEYRKSDQSVYTGNWHIRSMLHQSSHDALARGLYSKQKVNSWVITKPTRLWASARRNHENLAPNDFYRLCGREGVMKKTGMLQDVLIEGGAILTMERGVNQLCFGVELAEDYPRELLEEFEVFVIPETKYVVFNCPPYPGEAHGSVIESIWNAQRGYKPEEHGLEWNYGEAPIIESDSNEFGYTIWFPAKDKEEVR